MQYKAGILTSTILAEKTEKNNIFCIFNIKPINQLKIFQEYTIICNIFQ